MKFSLKALFAVLCLCSAVSAAGQGELRNFQFMVNSNPGTASSNPAFLDAWTGKLSMAELSFEKENGELRALDESADSWTLTALTESYYRISDKIDFHGLLSWSNFQGKGMGGQILLDPSYNPVNFLENTESTLGTKKKEFYTLSGGMSYEVNDRLSVGFSSFYQAGDMNKIKDPRFSNIWMDLDLDAGVRYVVSDFLSLGASLKWRNTLEQVKGQISGATGKQYFIDTDKGGFFGTVAELSGDYNYISESNARPMNNNWYGGAIQAGIRDVYCGELSFMMRNGYFGRKASASATYFEFSGMQLGYDGALDIPSGKNLHHAVLHAAYGTLSNDENIIKYNTPPGGNTVVVYGGQNHILDRSTIEASADYCWIHDAASGNPDFAAGARADFRSMSQETVLYPYYRRHGYSHVEAELYSQKSFSAGRIFICIDAAVCGYAGFGTKKDDGSYASSSSTSLKSFDSYLDKHFEFETAPRAGARLSLSFILPIKGGITPYISISDRFISLIGENEYLAGKTRNLAAVKLGCDF